MSDTAKCRNAALCDFSNNINAILVFGQALYRGRLLPKKKNIMITISNWWEGRIRTSSCTRTLLVPHLCFFGRSPFLPAGVVTGRRQGSGFNPVSTFSNGIGCQNSSCESRRPGYTSEIPGTMVNRGSLSIIVSCSSAGAIRITLGFNWLLHETNSNVQKKKKM